MVAEVQRAPIPLGPDGLWGSRNYATTPVTCLIDANNVDYYGGIITKEPGALQFSTATTILATTDTIRNGIDWWPTASSQEPVIVAASGALRRDAGSGTFTTTMASGLVFGSTTPPMFVEGGKESAARNRKLFLFTGQQQVKVVSGSGAAAATNLSKPASDWSAGNYPTFGFVCYDRLFVMNCSSNPHMVYYSTPVDHEDFTGAGSGTFLVYPGQGQFLMAGVEFKGFIILWKYPRGIYWIDMRDPDPNNWNMGTQSTHIGLAGPLAWCMVDDDILFLDQSGQLNAISRITPETYAAQNVSDKKQMRDFIANNIDTTRLWDARMVYYAYKREVHIALTGTGSTVNNRRLIVDLNQPGNPRFRWADRDTCTALWLQQDSSKIERPFIGDDTGRIYRLDYDSKVKGSSGYNATFQTAHTDLSHLDPALATRSKDGHFIDLTYESVGAYYLYIDVYWDEMFEATYTVRMGATSSGFPYTFPFTFAQRGRLQHTRIRITGSGRRFSMVCRNPNANEDFKLSAAWLGFTPGDERFD